MYLHYVKAGTTQMSFKHVAFEDTSYPGFDVCRPANHDSSLYMFVLVTFHEAVVVRVSV